MPLFVYRIRDVILECGFEYQSGQTKDNKISIGCFSTKNAASRSKNKDGLAPNQDNVSE
jgi:hypothetical protein